jgi:hypothetical protein
VTKKRFTKKDLTFRRRLRRDPFGRLSVALADYLESVGWSAVVVGEPRVQQQPGERAFNFEFVVRFTGGQKS